MPSGSPPPHTTRIPARPLWWAAAIFAAAAGYRLYLTLRQAPALGGDESVIGVMAMHIAHGDDFPAFFYGQHYMGPLEAYLAAPLVILLGPGLLPLRLATLLLFFGFYWAMWWAARAVFGTVPAIATCIMLAFGSDRVLRQELVANGGWSEMLLLGALLLGVTARLCTRTSGMWLFGLWGLLAGLGLWASPMFAPVAAAFAIVLAGFRRRDLPGWRGIAAAGGLLAGLAPMLVHNLRLPPGSRTTISDVLAYNPPVGDFHPVDHLNGLVHGIGLATGMCDVHCESWQLRWWPPIYLMLLATTSAASIVVLFILRRRRTPGDHELRVGHAILLALAGAAAATMLMFLQSVHSGMPRGQTWPVQETSRYLSNLLLATPAIVWTWWLALRSRALPAVMTSLVLAVTVAATAGAATGSVLDDGLPRERQIQQRHLKLMAELNRRGITRLHTDYFTCWRLIYDSGERILCSPIEPDLRDGVIRWQPYQQAVDADPRPFYAAETGSVQEANLEQRLQTEGIPAEVFTTDGYTVFHPARRPSTPTARGPS